MIQISQGGFGMNRTLKIFVACFLGAFIGTLVALQLEPYFWWVGVMVGGIVGYLAYEFREVLKAIRTAWVETIGYRPGKEKVVLRFWQSTSILNGITCFILGFGVVVVFCVYLASLAGDTTLTMEKNWFYYSTFFYISLVSLAAYILFMRLIHYFGEDEKDFFQKNPIELKKSILSKNPVIMLTYWPLYWLYRFVVGSIRVVVKYGPHLVPGAVKRLRLFGLFIKTVLIQIHSELRLLCMLDAAIGVLVGYFVGSALVGGLVGGVFGALNYEIISKRILKLVPVR